MHYVQFSLHGFGSWATLMSHIYHAMQHGFACYQTKHDVFRCAKSGN
jgi:hypothetical protein